MRVTLIIAVFLSLAWNSLAVAQPQATQPSFPPDPQKPDDLPPKAPAAPAMTYPRVVELSLTPAAEPRPALKYRLVPPAEERKTGNAAPYYYRAMMDQNPNTRFSKPGESRKHWDLHSKLLSSPMATFSQEDARAWLTGYEVAMREMHIATHREDCRWDHRYHDLSGLEAISFPVDEMNRIRHLVRILSVKVRLEISENNFAAALESLQDGYQISQDTSRSDFSPYQLVGPANANIMNDVVIKFIDQPNSPNLYWAIANIPRAHYQFQNSAEKDSAQVFQYLPVLKDAETAIRPEAEWRDLLEQGLTELRSEGIDLPTGNLKFAEGTWGDCLQIMTTALKSYPSAKQKLLMSGMNFERVEKMPVAQVVSIQAARDIRHATDELEKWSYLPYAAGHSYQKKALERLQSEGYFADDLTGVLLKLISPNLEATQLAKVRLERNFRAIQVIEAIRMHMAENGGKLPGSLNEIKVVPVPKNPVNDLPFGYTFLGDAKNGFSARLEVGGLAGYDHDHVVYVLTADSAK